MAASKRKISKSKNKPQHFKNLENGPNPDSLGFPQGAGYDLFIAGWTKYWNDILQFDMPLDPNVVKALIASESGFIPSTNIPKEALALASKTWPSRKPGLEQFKKDFKKTLSSSLYWPKLLHK